MIRVDSAWLATEQLDMRAGMDTAFDRKASLRVPGWRSRAPRLHSGWECAACSCSRWWMHSRPRC